MLWPPTPSPCRPFPATADGMVLMAAVWGGADPGGLEHAKAPARRSFASTGGRHLTSSDAFHIASRRWRPTSRGHAPAVANRRPWRTNRR